MKLRKNVVRLLTIGMMLNNVYFNADASNIEIPNRYQTLESEYITIDDSKEGELHEIEIFGNTVQDENNLEDIQSVGDLYVDEDGNPILDSQGREQYKINIVAQNNLFDINKADELPVKNYYYAGHSAFSILKLEPNTTYNISVIKTRETGGTMGYSYITNSALDNPTFILRESSSLGAKGNKLVTTNDDGEIWISRYSTLLWKYADIMITKSDSNSYVEYVPYQQNKIEMLLPTQLQKIKNIADRLYWDNEKERYVIEKNIKSLILDNTGNWITRNVVYNNVYDFKKTGYTDLRETGMAISNKYIVNGLYNYTDADKHIADYEHVSWLTSYNGEICVYVDKNKLDGDDVESFKKYFEETLFYYQSKTPEFIETNISSKLQIPTYEGQTHLYVETENGINPTLKVIVDRIEKISEEQVGIVENEPTAFNLSRARYFVNQMKESALKDQLQARLNTLSNFEDLTFERKTATVNLDVYIKCENMLSLSLNTNSVTFENYSGTEPMEKLGAINMTINSSLPYNINAYIPSEILSSNGTNQMDLDIFNIKESNETKYKQFKNTMDKVVLKENCEKGNNISHSIDLKLDSNDAHTPNVYKTTIKFEVEQK